MEPLDTKRPTAQAVADKIIQERVREDFLQVNFRDAQRWRMVKEFHPRLRMEHWDGHAWQPLYGEEADNIVDAYILEAHP